jgi:phosphoglycerate kinase
MTFKTLDDLPRELTGKRVLVRVDFNVPMQNGTVTDSTRLRAALPTISELSDRGAVVLLLSHFGRPKGQKRADMSTAVLVKPLSKLWGQQVDFVDDCAGPSAERAIEALQAGDVAILENTRFHPGEEENDAELAKAMARLGDYYVNDAFSAAHRAHASTEGITHHLPSFAGRAMEAELEALHRALENPERPVVAVVGGAKISTKLAVLGHLAARVDHLIIVGAMANTFFAAEGVSIGKSLCERDMIGEAAAIMHRAGTGACLLHFPRQVVVANELTPNPPGVRTCPIEDVQAGELILDAGPAATEVFADILSMSRTLVWNGPLGAFEVPPFDAATVSFARAAAALTKKGSLVSVAGGGDTVAALNHAGVAEDFSFVSTAGGAFLEWMEGRILPGVAVLENAKTMTFAEMSEKIHAYPGFIAALDQSGGSTPKALEGYGIEKGAWSNDEEMFGLIHNMRSRIITAPSFGSGKVIGAILFERTMDGRVNGKPTPQALIEQGIVPFIKIDKGLEAEANGVQLMKPMLDLDALLIRAKGLGVFGTKERSVINLANRNGIAAVVKQQFAVARQVLSQGMVPIIEPEVNIKSPERDEADSILLDELLDRLDELNEGEKVMLKLSMPAQAGLFQPLVDHPNVLRVVALSGGFSREEACRELAKNPGIIASFSRALLSDLRAQQSDEEFNWTLGVAIDEIYEASTVKRAQAETLTEPAEATPSALFVH